MRKEREYNFILKVKLKSILRPIKLEVLDESYIRRFFMDLNSDKEFIDIGPIAFKKEEFKYAYYEMKEVK